MYLLRTAARAVPPVLAVSTVLAMMVGDGPLTPVGVVLLVGLPSLAWAILAPTPLVAFVGGMVCLPGIAAWAFALDRADWTAEMRLRQWYPVVAAAAVTVAVTVSYAVRRRIGGVPRLVVGGLVLLASFGLWFALPPHAENAGTGYAISRVSTCDSPRGGIVGTLTGPRSGRYTPTCATSTPCSATR